MDSAIKELEVSKFQSDLKLKGFEVFQIEDDLNDTRIYKRKDFYKICLTTGKSKIHYADRSFDTEGTILFFANPHVPYSWETLCRDYVGYTILFSEDFYSASERSESLQQSSIFKVGGTPIFTITPEQRTFLNSIFKNMIDEQKSDYQHKNDVIRNYINLILHEALKLQPAEDSPVQKNAASRITNVFLELLERQFPIETPERPLQLKAANDFADALHVHVNYLNRVVKDVTGKSTTAHISERIIREAKTLLQHTQWNISEIGFALGFEYPTYFNNYFKNKTGTNPKAFRLTEI